MVKGDTETRLVNRYYVFCVVLHTAVVSKRNQVQVPVSVLTSGRNDAHNKFFCETLHYTYVHI